MIECCWSITCQSDICPSDVCHLDVCRLDVCWSYVCWSDVGFFWLDVCWWEICRLIFVSDVKATVPVLPAKNLPWRATLWLKLQFTFSWCINIWQGQVVCFRRYVKILVSLTRGRGRSISVHITSQWEQIIYEDSWVSFFNLIKFYDRPWGACQVWAHCWQALHAEQPFMVF